MALVKQNNNSSALPSIWFDTEGTDEKLKEGVDLLVSGAAASIMVIACGDNLHSASQLKSFLGACAVPVFGGIFPGLFFEGQHQDRGILLIGLPFNVQIDIYENLQPGQLDIDIPSWQDGKKIDTAADLMIFIDSMSKATEVFINTLYETIGGGNCVIGGGAGTLDFIQRPCLFTRAGLLQDAALVVKLPIPMCCAVDHGWEVLDGPYLVTEAKGTKVNTIDYLPAFNVYRDSIERITEYQFNKNNFFQIAKNFPLGVVGINEEIMVRDPVQRIKNELICVGCVPTNTMIYILHGRRKFIIEAAYLAGEQSGLKLKKITKSSMGLAVVFDCISRSLYLGDDFSDELLALNASVGDGKTIIGILSIGEIANTDRGTINLLNKSVVVGQF
jgi:hypothetical protein